MCLEDYVQPALREIATQIIFHVGTNDVLTKKDSDHIFGNIINLAIKLNKNCDVSMSTITKRNDQYQRKIAGTNRKSKKTSLKKITIFKPR